MNPRIEKIVWQLSAQSMGAGNYLICALENAYYVKKQGSTDGTSMAPFLAASLAKANASLEIFRPSKRFNSFISPLLGPFRIYVRVPFFGSKQFKMLHLIWSTNFQLKHGNQHV